MRVIDVPDLLALSLLTERGVEALPDRESADTAASLRLGLEHGMRTDRRGRSRLTSPVGGSCCQRRDITVSVAPSSHNDRLRRKVSSRVTQAPVASIRASVLQRLE